MPLEMDWCNGSAGGSRVFPPCRESVRRWAMRPAKPGCPSHSRTRGKPPSEVTRDPGKSNFGAPAKESWIGWFRFSPSACRARERIRCMQIPMNIDDRTDPQSLHRGVPGPRPHPGKSPPGGPGAAVCRANGRACKECRIPHLRSAERRVAGPTHDPSARLLLSR